MGSLDRAIQSTKKYAKFFGLPLTPDNLEKYLITPKPLKLSKIITNSSKDSRLIKSRQQISQEKINRLLSRLWLFRLVPSIDLVAITGSVAINNAVADDDIDLMIVTSENTLWLTRFVVVVLLKLLGWRRSAGEIRDKFCDNLYLDQSALVIPKNKRNLYTAHEVLQIKPILDRKHSYDRFIHSNSWTKKYLANAYSAISGQSSAVAALNTENWLLTALNFAFYKIQYHFMKSKITNETITLHSAYFHPHDYSKEIGSL